MTIDEEAIMGAQFSTELGKAYERVEDLEAKIEKLNDANAKLTAEKAALEAAIAEFRARFLCITLLCR